MPIIRQERGVKVIAGLPERWGRRAYQELAALLKAPEGAKSQGYKDLAALLDTVTASPIPLDATDAHLCVLADRYAADCAGVPMAESLGYLGLPPGDGVGPRQYGAVEGMTERDRMAQICEIRGIEPAKGSDEQAMKRMVDRAWWRRNLAKVHGRAAEHAGMRLGFVSMKTGSYCSNETVARRLAQVERNKAALKSQVLRNEQGQEFNLYDLAQKGMGNKTNRKGELMLRMAGCESVAGELGHVGLFVTLTCPSKYHAVVARTGQFNPKYRNATPRQAQDYLNGVWVLTRAQNARDGIAPYGFRIAEPHHDGCPHWHMLVFMPRDAVAVFVANLAKYAMAEDAYELNSDSAREARLKVIEIDPSKGTAAGYIAKYVGKNIDDSQGEAYDEEGAVNSDMTGERVTPACARVDAWAAVWGIRQFQGLGMPPVTVWRELRRVKDVPDDAPDYVMRALKACQRKVSKFCDAETGEFGLIQAANFGDYIRAQGGVNMGRDYRIGVKLEPLEVAGKYGMVVRNVPRGVYAKEDLDAVYPSVRYTWLKAGAVGRSWSPLNNCTPLQGLAPRVGPFMPSWWVESYEELTDFDDSEWFGSDEYAEMMLPPDLAGAQWHEAEMAACETRADTVWTLLIDPAAYARRGQNEGV